MIYNHMPDWIYASKDLSSSAKLVMERIFSLSKDGSQRVFVNREIFSKCLGLSVRTLSNTFKELVSFDLLEEVASSDKWNKTKRFLVTSKACKDESLENCTLNDEEKIATPKLKNLQDRESNNCNTEVEKNSLNEEKIATSKLQNLQDRESNNCNIEVEKNSLNEEKIATSKLQNLQDLHQIEIKNDKERILDIYNTQQKQQSVQAQKTIEYPTSAKDCELLFESYISKYKQEHQALMGLPISMEAEKFFLYWSEKGWKRGKTKIKSLAGCVATWVGNWLDRNERRYPKTMTPRTLEQEITSYRAYGEEVERFVKEREQQGKTSLTIEDFQVIAG